MQTARAAQAVLRAVAKPERVDNTKRFFKAYPGGYSEGDMFLGCTVPATRLVAKQFYGLPLAELDKLISSKWHDDRLLALIILVRQYQRGGEAVRQNIYDFYMAHTANVNNWDLVDSSSEFMVGPYLEAQPEKMKVLQKLATSNDLWERRIAMLATFDYIRKHRADEALTIAEQLLHDQHDLIQKAVGWMLREIGKRVSKKPLRLFLDKHAATMPRTTLRYALEHFEPVERARYMAAKSVQ
ncbi:MAG TPA: DNA alkylation repair protein [Candidatus Saccharimonadales bacterium]|nr:DNA alkylation repair protein [Candidatus Saccharimonadales bacterium]